MTVREVKMDLPTPHGRAPMLVHHAEHDDRFRGTVLLYHGLGSHKEVQRKEAHWLAEAGFLSVTVDAWGHGERRLEDYDDAVRGDRFYTTFPRMIRHSIEEIPSLIDGLVALLGPQTGGFGVSGISMGGYITFGAALVEPRLRALVPLLGSPEWVFPMPVDADFLASSPHLHVHKFVGRAVLAMNGALDTNVPPAAARRFMQQLQPFYETFPERLQYIEYAESPHFMREEDWNDAWMRTVEWFTRFL